MSSATRSEQTSRTWWSLSKASNKDLRKQYGNGRPSDSISRTSSGRSFPSFASVIGFKSKKHPTLTIEEPPSPLQSYSASRPARDGPPSQYNHEFQSGSRPKSGSQPLSPADSLEPITPMDGPGERRQSLLTLSDTDPFASRVISVHAPPSPNISAHSSNSFLDISAKQEKTSLFARGSYSSSSSNSHSPKVPPPQSSLSVNNANMRVLAPSKSLGNLRRKPTGIESVNEAPIHTVPQSNSQPNSRPPTRSRGMTEAGSTRPSFLEEEPSVSRTRRPSSAGKSVSSADRGTISMRPSPASHPPSAGRAVPGQPAVTPQKPVVRQGSLQRAALPPSAPPTHGLPAPPSGVPEEAALEHDADILRLSAGSVSSSSLSFVSSASSSTDIISAHPHSPRKRERLKSPDKSISVNNYGLDLETGSHVLASSSKPHPPSPSPKTLKKAISHSSLTKRSLSTQTPALTSLEPAPEAVPRKQRSYHRLPIPPLTLGFRHGHTTSISTPASPQATEVSHSIPAPVEQKRGSTASHSSIPVRKRVFSGSSSRRPSTSSGIRLTEEDSRSLFSLRSDREIISSASAFKPWPATISTAGSFWEDTADQTSLSPVQSDYTPQRIMSPEALAKVEAELDDISIMSPLPSTVPLPSNKGRTASMTSTVLSDRDSEILPPNFISLPVSELTGSPQRGISGTGLMSGAVNGSGLPMTRASSLIARSPPSSLPYRPSTASGGTLQLRSAISISTIREPQASNAPTPFPTPKSTTPTSPTAPLNVNKARRKNSGASDRSALVMRSLPPPPRPRNKAQVISEPPRLKPTPGLEPKKNTRGLTHDGETIYSRSNTNTVKPMSKSPPTLSFRRPRGETMQSPIMEAVMNRKSLLKKPSFLDIDDDDDIGDNMGNIELDFGRSLSMRSSNGTLKSSAQSESFLEFGRESLDTIRSSELEQY